MERTVGAGEARRHGPVEQEEDEENGVHCECARIWNERYERERTGSTRGEGVKREEGATVSRAGCEGRGCASCEAVGQGL